MRPGKFDLNLYRGDTYAWDFSLWQDPEQTVPVDLTGVIAKAEIREAPAGLSVIELVCSVSDNVVTVKIDVDAWSAGSKNKGVWDLQLTYLDGRVFTVLSGNVVVTADVTDSQKVGRR
jgi:hypothetical protein